MRTTDKDRACGAVFSCKVDKNDFPDHERSRWAVKNEKTHSLRTSLITSYTRMCILLSTSLPLYEISNTYIPASGHVFFLAFCFGVS